MGNKLTESGNNVELSEYQAVEAVFNAMKDSDLRNIIEDVNVSQAAVIAAMTELHRRKADSCPDPDKYPVEYK